jgi:glycosyltransferase involved in cell wall biosynthesis
MKLSIVIPIGGNDYLRGRNFNECLKCINEQTFKDFEIIVVEQSLDGNFYKTSSKYKHIGINDPLNRGFNLSWCRNVGAKEAEGDILVLMDSDFVFDKDYFKVISEFKGKFAAGAETYYWCNREDPTTEWLKTKDLESIRSKGSDNHLSHVFKFRSMTKGSGYGAILVYNKEWFFNVLGGYNENFFKYGWEDKATTESIKFLLNKNDEELDRIPYEAFHLFHLNKDTRNLKTNEVLFKKFTTMDQIELCEAIKKINIGKIESPTLLI